MRYHHTQIGHLIIAVLTCAIFIITILMAVNVFTWVAFAALCILAICLLLFSFLTVTIQDNILELKFGPGIYRKKFNLSDIESCQAVKNKWYYGWGIHLTPHGWLFNVSGFQAVEINLKSGKKYRIGTDAPGELEEALRKAIDTGSLQTH